MKRGHSCAAACLVLLTACGGGGGGGGGDDAAGPAIQCASAPPGALVDGRGCPLDGDTDGSYDGLDRCPEIPGVAALQGCPASPPEESGSDADGDVDGVVDAADLCPGTPAGEAADEDGCGASQRDGDGDGLNDGSDRCPQQAGPAALGGCPLLDGDADGISDARDQCAATAAGAEVDGAGCAASQRDTDGDGVSDARDQCAATVAGAEVDGAGCAASQRDTDGDGVSDARDQCAATVAGAEVDGAGCAASQRDTDGDGISDARDQCAATAAGAEVDGAGCAASQRDTDGDGVSDARDQCAATAAGAEVDGAGCAASQRDTDGDGVSDARDQCAATAAGAEVDGAGCAASQRDSDGDGVNDAQDQCPATAAADADSVDATGCYRGEEDDIKLVYAINAGGDNFLAGDGTFYAADNHFIGGSVSSNDRSVAGTAGDLLFQSDRQGDFRYALPVADGRYRVVLKFTEAQWSAVHQRSFDVAVEGEVVAYHFDLYAILGRRDVPYALIHDVEVADGQLDLAFSSVVGEAKLSALRVTIAPDGVRGGDDADDDGVVDGGDRCAHTPADEKADSSGCSPSQLAGSCRNGSGSAVLVAGASVEEVVPDREFKWTEGPVADSRGNLYFTDLSSSRIHRYSTAGEFSTFLSPTNLANGLYFDANDRLYLCERSTARVSTVDPSTVTASRPRGDLSVLVTGSNGIRFNQTNDIWIAPNGGIYLTDPCHKCTQPMRQGSEQVFYVTPDRRQVIRVTNNLYSPNGVIGTPDGKVLYVSDSRQAYKVYRYRINDDGTLSDRSDFLSVGSDGMAIDCENNLYITARDPQQPSANYVGVYDRGGRRIQQILVPELPANVGFAGEDRDILYITATSSLYAIRTRVRGMPNNGGTVK